MDIRLNMSFSCVKFTFLNDDFDMITRQAYNNPPKRPQTWENLAQPAIDRHNAALASAQAEAFLDRSILFQDSIDSLELRIKEQKSFFHVYLQSDVSGVYLSAFSSVIQKMESELLALRAKYAAFLDGGEVEPPTSNTGGIESLDYVVLDHDGVKVRAPKPLETSSPHAAIIDFLTFTFKVPDFYSAFPDSFALSVDGFDIVCSISEYLQDALGFAVTSQCERGKNFYKNAYILGDSCGFLCIGGQRESVCVVLTGQGLMAARSGWESRIKDFGERVGAKITRVDVARDFFFGEYTVDQADLDDDNGLFSFGARPPKIQYFGNWKREDGSGRTLQIGSRISGKLARVYEKGFQLGGPYSEMFRNWVRVEVELHNKDRFIPWDVLLNPGQYLAGAYPAFAFISEEQTRIKTKKNVIELTVDKARGFVKAQVGKYLWLFHELDGFDGIKELFVDEMPRRLVFPDWTTSPPPISMPVYSEIPI